jgi:single-stranded DNA-binding protein
LTRLSDGDAVAVQGSLKADFYDNTGGQTKLSVGVIAEDVLPLRQPGKNRKKEGQAYRSPTRLQLETGRSLN